MHVLVIPSWYPSTQGDINGSFFREQAIALQQAGNRVGVVYPKMSSIKDWRTLLGLGKRGFEQELDQGMPTLRMHSTNWFPFRYREACAWWIRQGMELYTAYEKLFGRPNIIHAHSALYGGALARELRQREGVPYVVTEHSSMFLRGGLRRDQVEIARRVFVDAHRKYAVSTGFAGHLGRQFGMESEPWRVIPNSVDSIFANYPVQTLRTSEGLRFISVGMLTENKRIDSLVAAFRAVLRHYPKAQLRIAGDGPERAKLERIANEHGIADQIVFLGSLTRRRVVEEVSEADVLVQPSRYETFGVAIIEALALGKPVIATRCGGPEDIVTSADGILVPADDNGMLVEAMKSMCLDIGAYDAARIRQSCIARFGAGAVAERYIQEYEEVLEENPEGSRSTRSKS